MPAIRRPPTSPEADPFGDHLCDTGRMEPLGFILCLTLFVYPAGERILPKQIRLRTETARFAKSKSGFVKSKKAKKRKEKRDFILLSSQRRRVEEWTLRRPGESFTFRSPVF